MKQIPKTSQKRRMKGKLTKKEQMMMKKTHRDIGWLLAVDDGDNSDRGLGGIRSQKDCRGCQGWWSRADGKCGG